MLVLLTYSVYVLACDDNLVIHKAYVIHLNTASVARWRQAAMSSSLCALVVGIDDYSYIDPLTTAVADATAVHKLLTSLGAQSTLLTNAGKDGLETSLSTLLDTADELEVVRARNPACS